jgi:hypothetical protein
VAQILIFLVDFDVPNLFPGQVMWDLWWTEWRWSNFSPRNSVSPTNSHSANYFIFINHPSTDYTVSMLPASLNNKRKNVVTTIEYAWK